MIERNSTAAKKHPLIKEFVQLVKETVGDGILNFSDLQSRPFIKFGKNYTILKYLEDDNEFQSILCGRALTEAFGSDQTGKKIAELGFNEIEVELRQLHFDAMRGKTIYASCTFAFQDREYKKWHQVKMPLTHSGRTNETVGVIVFE